MFTRPRPQNRVNPRAKTASEQAQVVSLFGPPGVGCSSIVQTIREASRTPITILSAIDSEGALDMRVVQATRAIGPKGIVLIDGYPACRKDPDGRITGPDQIQYLFDRRLIYPGSGLLVRVGGPTKSARPEAERVWSEALNAVEARIRLLDIPYVMIQNEPGEEGLIASVSDLATRLRLS